MNTSRWGQLTETKKIWGTSVNVWMEPETSKVRWEPLIERPIEKDGWYWKGINEKILADAKAVGAEIILNDMNFLVPPKKELGRKRREGEAKIIQGYYGKPFVVYLFKISRVKESNERNNP